VSYELANVERKAAISVLESKKIVAVEPIRETWYYQDGAVLAEIRRVRIRLEDRELE